MATGGFALLVAIGVSSIKHFRHKLGYDRWHSLHQVEAVPTVVAELVPEVLDRRDADRDEQREAAGGHQHVQIGRASCRERASTSWPTAPTWQKKRTWPSAE